MADTGNFGRQRFILHGVDLTKFDGGAARDSQIIPSIPAARLAKRPRERARRGAAAAQPVAEEEEAVQRTANRRLSSSEQATAPESFRGIMLNALASLLCAANVAAGAAPPLVPVDIIIESFCPCSASFEYMFATEIAPLALSSCVSQKGGRRRRSL
eukprot:COSAG05_NODE_333_length_11249_cov_629.633094_4_plen_157_part_00